MAPSRGEAARGAIAVRGTYLDDEDVARLLKLSLPGIDEVIGLVEVTRLARGVRRRRRRYRADRAHPASAGRAGAARPGRRRLLDGAPVASSSGRQCAARVVPCGRRRRADRRSRSGRGRASCDAARRRRREISWVTLPEPMALEETADAMSALDAEGIRVRRLIVNRMTPRPGRDDGGCAWCEARRRFESRALSPWRLASVRDAEISVSGTRSRAPGCPCVARAGSIARALAPSDGLAPSRSPHPSRAPQHQVRGQSLFPQKKGTVPFSAGLFGGVRWLLFGGKGGVGKSTCAAAAALRPGRRRARPAALD